MDFSQFQGAGLLENISKDEFAWCCRTQSDRPFIPRLSTLTIALNAHDWTYTTAHQTRQGDRPPLGSAHFPTNLLMHPNSCPPLPRLSKAAAPAKNKKTKTRIRNPSRRWVAWWLSVQTNTEVAVVCTPSHSVRPNSARSNRHTRLSGLDPSLPFVFQSTWQTSTLQFHFLGKQLSDRAAFRSAEAQCYDNLGISANSLAAILRKRAPLVFKVLPFSFEWRRGCRLTLKQSQTNG